MRKEPFVKDWSCFASPKINATSSHNKAKLKLKYSAKSHQSLNTYLCLSHMDEHRKNNVNQIYALSKRKNVFSLIGLKYYCSMVFVHSKALRICHTSKSAAPNQEMIQCLNKTIMDFKLRINPHSMLCTINSLFANVL